MLKRIATLFAVLALSVFSLVAIQVLARKAVSSPAASPFAAAVFVLGAAWAGHTARSLVLRDAFLGALRDIDYADGDFAVDAGLTNGLASEQLHGDERPGPALWRLGGLPPEFFVAFGTRLVKQFGNHEVLPSNSVLLQAVRTMETLAAEYRAARREVAA
jgi:hypothetical protein